MNNRIEIQTFQTTDELLEDKKWWQIYEESFLPEERFDPEIITRGVREQFGMVLSARNRGNTVGMAIVEPLSNVPCSVLWYIATEKDRHSAGIGSQILQMTLARCKSEYGITKDPYGLVAELEDPDEGDILADEAYQRRRRLDFYLKKNRSQLIKPDYFQPPLRETDSPFPMNLILCSDGLEIDADFTKKVICDLYRLYEERKKVGGEVLQQLLVKMGITKE